MQIMGSSLPWSGSETMFLKVEACFAVHTQFFAVLVSLKGADPESG